MGRKARHSARTGDGDAEVRLRAQQMKEAQKVQKDAELRFYDDPSANESDSEQVESEEDELAGDQVLELGKGEEEEDEAEEEEKEVEMVDEDGVYDADAERRTAMQMEGKWGKSRKMFYSADTAEYELESDEEVAKDEEEAALELQRKQVELMDDEDFGIDAPETDGEEEEEEEEMTIQEVVVDDEELVSEQLAGIAALADNGAGGAETVEQVHKDFSKMTKQDKLQIVNQSAPELLGLISELDSTTKELAEVVTPAVLKLRPVRRKPRQLQMGLRYLMTRQNLLLNYSASISFYLLLRAEGKSVSDHPVLMHLLLLKKQLNKLRTIDEVLNDQFQDLLTKELPTEPPSVVDDGLGQFFAKSDRKRSSNTEKVLAKKTTKKQKVAAKVSAEELAEAERFYEETVRDQTALRKAKKELYTHETPALASSDEESGETGKRGASYQIMKNKGLKAHKSKLNRNPRVKKRMQYRKAVIRRKGQVRDVRVGEAGKYGGETTGIKSNVTRSRKIRN